MSTEPKLLRIDIKNGVFSIPIEFEHGKNSEYWIARLDDEGRIVRYIEKPGLYWTRKEFLNSNRFIAWDVSPKTVLLFHASDGRYNYNFKGYVVEKTKDYITLEIFPKRRK